MSFPSSGCGTGSIHVSMDPAVTVEINGGTERAQTKSFWFSILCYKWQDSPVSAVLLSPFYHHHHTITSMIGGGGAHRDHSAWKKGHMTCETPVFCECAQSLKQRTWLKEKVVIPVIWLGFRFGRASQQRILVLLNFCSVSILLNTFLFFWFMHSLGEWRGRVKDGSEICSDGLEM